MRPRNPHTAHLSPREPAPPPVALVPLGMRRKLVDHVVLHAHDRQIGRIGAGR